MTWCRPRCDRPWEGAHALGHGPAGHVAHRGVHGAWPWGHRPSHSVVGGVEGLHRWPGIEESVQPSFVSTCCKAHMAADMEELIMLFVEKEL